jgi:hypothetical protein
MFFLKIKKLIIGLFLLSSFSAFSVINLYQQHTTCFPFGLCSKNIPEIEIIVR